MRLLLTGAGGFVGSHIAEYMAEATDWEIVPVPFIHRGLARQIGHIDYIIHAAALADVRTSLEEPGETIQLNVNATLDMLEMARQLRPRAFIQISTNEVYGPACQGLHGEWSPIVPGSPYAASKAAQEAIAIAYWRSYHVPVVITNTQNLFGERQQPNKLIPTCVRKVMSGEPVALAAGSNYWLHARDHAAALLFLLRGQPALYPAERPDRFNIRGDQELTNERIAELVADALGLPLHCLSTGKSDQPGHDASYALDSKKLSGLGWHPVLPVEESIRRTALSFASHPEWLAA